MFTVCGLLCVIRNIACELPRDFSIRQRNTTDIRSACALVCLMFKLLSRSATDR